MARREKKKEPEKAAWAEQKGAESGIEKAEAESESYLSEVPQGIIHAVRWPGAPTGQGCAILAAA